MTLPNGAGFDFRLLWEVTPQAIGRLGGLVVPLDNKGPPTVFFTAASKSCACNGSKAKRPSRVSPHSGRTVLR